jgi:hypothetical protein
MSVDMLIRDGFESVWTAGGWGCRRIDRFNGRRRLKQEPCLPVALPSSTSASSPS